MREWGGEGPGRETKVTQTKAWDVLSERGQFHGPDAHVADRARAQALGPERW